MVGPENVVSPDIMKLGFGFAGALFTLWWNLQYLRFMRFLIEPPYKAWTVGVFRIFFALCFGGALSSFIQDIARTPRSQVSYLEVFKVVLGWCVLIVAMVYLAEYIQRNRRQSSENMSGK
jgi:uncharacterized membrane protein YwzB